MRKLIISAAVCAAFVGVALAQVEAGSSTYLLDIDPARYAGPASQRLTLRVDDEPRYVTLGEQDQVCVQLKRVAGQDEVINARIRTLSPEPMTADVRVVAPDISPGTYRSTPWGMLVRAMPNRADGTATTQKVSFKEAPVCTI